MSYRSHLKAITFQRERYVEILCIIIELFEFHYEVVFTNPNIDTQATRIEKQTRKMFL